jgi:hypothetical protein
MGTVIGTRSEMRAPLTRSHRPARPAALRGPPPATRNRRTPPVGRTMTRLNSGKARRTACQQHLSERARSAGSASPTFPSLSCISARITPGETTGPRGTTTTPPTPATRPGRPETAKAPGRLSPASSRYDRHTAWVRAAPTSSRRSHNSRGAASIAGTSTTGSPPATRTPSRPWCAAAPVAIWVNQQIVSESIRFPLRLRLPVPRKPATSGSPATNTTYLGEA